MKKFWAILLAMMLVLSMVTVAGATEVTTTPTIDAATAKITAPDNGHTYEILQIFKGDLHNSVLSNLVWGKNGNGTEGDAVPETNINELKAKVRRFVSTSSTTC